MSDLAAELAKLQADLPPITRTQDGQMLKIVRPILADHEFVWFTQPTLWTQMNGEIRFVLRYRLEHVPSGEAIEGNYPLAEGPPQQQGSVITYARRYALTSVLDLAIKGEDTDAMDTPSRRPQRSQTTGAEHERLRHGTHVGTPDMRPADRGPLPDDENPWQGPPPADLETQPGSIDPKDRTRIMVACGQIPRQARLDKVSALAGREISSVNDLSLIEGRMVRDRLEGKP